MAKDFYSQEIQGSGVGPTIPNATPPAAPKKNYYAEEITATPALVKKYERLAATPPLMTRAANMSSEVFQRPGGIRITGEDIAKLIGPELETAGEVLPAVPGFMPFNAVTNAAVSASEGKFSPKQLVKSIIESLPFGKAIKTAATEGPQAILDQQSLTEPLNLHPPRELLINAIKAVKPDFKPPEGFLPNLGMDLAGGVITGAPLVAAEGALKSTGEALSNAETLRALEALKNNPQRISRIFAKGRAMRMAAEPKALPFPADMGDGFKIVPREVSEAQLQKTTGERQAFLDALRPRLKALPPPSGQGQGFEILPAGESRRRLSEQLRQSIQTGSSGPKAPRVIEVSPVPDVPGVAAVPPVKKLTKFDTPEVLAAREQQQNAPLTHLINTPERIALRNKIAEDYYGAGAKKQGRRADLVIGPPAAGKSSVVVKPLAKKYGSMVIDSDGVKAMLPEYNGGKNNGAIHQESADIAANLVLKKAIINGDNFVKPMVGKNISKLNAMIQELNGHGYEVHLHMVDLPPQKAAARAVERLKSDGQFVDPNYVLNEVGLKPRQNYDILKKEEGVSSYAKYSNDVKPGQKPRFIERGTNGGRQPDPAGRGGRYNAADLAVNPEAGQEVRAFPQLISPKRSQEIQALEKEVQDIVDSEKAYLEREAAGARGGEVIRPEGTGPGFRQKLPSYLKHPVTGNKPTSAKQFEELARHNLGTGNSIESPAYREANEALIFARKKAAEGGFARIGKDYSGMSEDEIRAEVQKRLDKAIGEGKKERKFIGTVRESKNTDPKVSARVEGVYDPITNKQTLEDANKLIAENPAEAHRLANSDDTPTAFSNAVAQRLADMYQKSGRMDDAIDIIEKTAQKATAQGQAIQALSMYNRLTPEGTLAYAQRVFDKARREIVGSARFSEEEFNKLPRAVQNQIEKLKLTPELADDLKALAKAAQDAVDPRDKAIASARLMKKIANQLPVSLWKKISFVQTLAQLLNPKTAIRNTLGNAGFSALENISDATGSAFDAAVSLVTGKRAKVFPDVRVQFKGMGRGFKEGIQDLKAGVNTGPGHTQYDLPAPGIFKSKVGQAFEKMLNLELQVPDRMAYTAAYEGSLNNQMRAAGVKVPTDAMLETAHQDALYRTFQDNSVMAKVFGGLKKALNAGGDFGLGDAVLKYPKTPANILARGIDYSPAGFIKTVFELGKGLTGHGFDQKAFVESASRAFTGTGLVGTGILLSKLGLITGRTKESSGITDLRKHIGLGDYKINISGLKRFIMSGFDAAEATMRKGDTLKTYDWFLPQAIDVAIGANIQENKGRPVGVVGTIADAIASGTRTLAEQPLVSGLQKLFGYGDVVGGIGEIAKGIPASFTPTLLRQIGMLMDDIRRNPDNENPIKESANLVKLRIPGLSKQLPPKPGPFGDDVHYLKDAPTTAGKVVEAFLDPAITTKYGQPPETKAAEQLIKFNVPVAKQGKSLRSIELTKDERAAIDATTAPLAKKLLMNFVESPIYQGLNDFGKQKALEAIMSRTKTVSEAANAPAIARRLVGAKK